MNLNIEGTRHEKAVLVILAYVSGFTAGFLVFGISSLAQPQPESLVFETPAVQATDSAPSLEGAPTSEVSSPEDVTVASDGVSYSDGRLTAVVNGASVLLSAQIATVDPDTAQVFASQGTHQALPNYETSPDGKFVYYCEQHSSEDTCMNFMFNVDEEVIDYVTLDGERYVSNASVAQTATWNNGILTIGNAQSVSAATPWKLVSNQ